MSGEADPSGRLAEAPWIPPRQTPLWVGVLAPSVFVAAVIGAPPGGLPTASAAPGAGQRAPRSSPVRPPASDRSGGWLVGPARKRVEDHLALAAEVGVGHGCVAVAPVAGPAGQLGVAASGVRPTIAAMSSKGTANMSWSTNANRSAGDRVSSTMRRARPTESASSVSCSGSIASTALDQPGRARATSSGSSARVGRRRSMFRHTRATTVVSHPPRFSMLSLSARLSRSHVCCTASSASLIEPSIR